MPPAIGAAARKLRVDPEAAEEVQEPRRWPESSAGGLMTTEFIALPPELRIGDAIGELRQRPRGRNLDNYLYRQRQQ